MTRRLLLLTLSGLAVLLPIGMWLLWPSTGITRRNAARIQTGMTFEEVEQILGGSARDERTGFTRLDTHFPHPQEASRLRSRSIIIGLAANGEGAHIWHSDQVSILVEFTDEWRVSETHMVPLS